MGVPLKIPMASAPLIMAYVIIFSFSTIVFLKGLIDRSWYHSSWYLFLWCPSIGRCPSEIIPPPEKQNCLTVCTRRSSRTWLTFQATLMTRHQKNSSHTTLLISWLWKLSTLLPKEWPVPCSGTYVQLSKIDSCATLTLDLPAVHGQSRLWFSCGNRCRRLRIPWSNTGQYDFRLYIQWFK